mmetsp:Transcript_5728/g.8107  ORF Transcript_5728/g.8107 Transcript_5728/m.8107 type:complete len:419 (-) Transcript_5728:255-1511(-)|eukprot:CAMPEP_0194032942 /NCGR_PEP_ID=MMETSP0009_2-20130614/5773_1 /TAXON_ID=210454 /ORGANISM="Grammatophora oceanica, Strain CCMP 410" /LENGTH=418 /DNA_ID=CAMNT_0038673527 /DNA_START=237 /DNA_END=1493 /DNA_ORIENTATION=+
MTVLASTTHEAFTETEIPIVTGASVEELLREHEPQAQTQGFVASASPPTQESSSSHVLPDVAFGDVAAPATVTEALPSHSQSTEPANHIGVIHPPPPAATYGTALPPDDSSRGVSPTNEPGVTNSANPFNFLCMAATDRLAKEDVQQTPFALPSPLPAPQTQPQPQPPKKKRGPKKGKPMAVRRPHVANPKRRYVAGLQDTGSKRDLQWNIMFMRLQDYKFEKGDTNVPQGYKEDPELATWVKNQRQAYKCVLQTHKRVDRKTVKRISPDRVTRLNHIGFEWRKYNKSQEDPLGSTTVSRTRVKPIQAYTIPVHPPPAQYYAPHIPPDSHQQQQLVQLQPATVMDTSFNAQTASLPPPGMVPGHAAPQPAPGPAPLGIPTIIHHLHHPVTAQPTPAVGPVASTTAAPTEAHLLCTESV